MRCRRIAAAVLLPCWLGAISATTRASVDLELLPPADPVAPGALLDVGLYAAAGGGAAEAVSALDVVLTWDPNVVELISAVNNGPTSWALAGLMPDSQLDGLNDSLADGDALFQALSFSPVNVPPAGLLITTLRFRALAPGSTTLIIEPQLGDFSQTQVLAAGGVNVDITGALGSALLEVAAELSVDELTLPAGQVGRLVVSGEIDGEAFGVTVSLGFVARSGSVGLVTFTPAAGPTDTDILLLNDPWPGPGGTFMPFDTDLTGSPLFNGAVMDNGSFLNEPVVFSGPLMSFGVVAAADALGVWDVVFDESTARWESPDLLPTGLIAGVVHVVAFGDGDGSESIEVRDFSDLQTCFTGDVGPAEPPAYPVSGGSRCAAYDFDVDGDVDSADYAAFMGLLTGP